MKLELVIVGLWRIPSTCMRMMLKTSRSPVYQIAQLSDSKASWIEQHRVTSSSCGCDSYFERGTSLSRHAPVWYCTGPYHTVQERAVPYYRVRGTRYVLLYDLHACKQGELYAVHICFRTAGCERVAAEQTAHDTPYFLLTARREKDLNNVDLCAACTVHACIRTLVVCRGIPHALQHHTAIKNCAMRPHLFASTCSCLQIRCDLVGWGSQGVQHHVHTH